ncbi:PREDICTED: dystrophin-like [Nicrophorus vespilloides]|uniref:Dystrophin-like n=1 Tax=Nicrophorus vespilloides TaxID=110193 RepID=A0ABM1MPJ0_NICVS|nr:PREDICTED: dystrophin-like [Nicrophorus vespilloides]
MSSSWRKVENENGFPFYVNELDNTKQWDNPKYTEIQQRIDDCNFIKYANYRVASKIQAIQQSLYLNEVSLVIISGVFEKHRLGITEGTLCLESCDLEAVLSDIYFATKNQNHLNFDVDFICELALNFFYNIYDKERKFNIDVTSIKLVLALMSGCPLLELYKFIFNLCCDHNNCVTRMKLQTVMTKMTKLTEYLNESLNFGTQLVASAVEHCFNSTPGFVGVNESTFIGWLESTPAILTWLPIVHRLNAAQNVFHNAKCSVCKISPIKGLKYRCGKCFRYTQCQRCFFQGRVSHTHKIYHSMKEYCGQAIDLKRRLCQFMGCHKYDDSIVGVADAKLFRDLVKDEVNMEPQEPPLNQLQLIIRQLEMQNRDLQQVLLLGNRTEKDMKRYLEEHRLHVSTQISKLKVLKEHLNSKPTLPCVTNSQLESTPMPQNGRSGSRALKDLEFFSPISSKPEIKEPEARLSKIPSFNLDKSCKEYNSSMPYSIKDISTWIGGNNPTNSDCLAEKSPPVQTDLDDALIKLQQILANNFSLDESLGNVDNFQLKNAVTEVEGMLSSIIDNVECNKLGTNVIDNFDFS